MDSEAVQTTIAEDIEITGSVKCASTIQIDGKLNGDLSSSGNTTIGANAVINGNIASDSAVVKGQVNGNVTAKDRIQLTATAKLTGDIRAKRLSVEDGATLIGKTEVNPSGQSPARATPDHKPVQPAAEEGVLEEDTEAEDKGKGLFQKK
ncbi:MAG: polymer-forming cytoskeletal protein [Kiritimatiellia bacterium]|jgi:cytoskeletal protein CcmA (bactofilin family)|nr:polymer-forming cytoskeletal protein [Kiritimatiellia bacterium]MDP6630934.1 polymer-forming cytoskeletal protein [Kiritimatiellia bacterium]MDP6810317.1 polymer-forming cytoskeletal protein [Kiritimatiellia bacterium]MDP7022694.1 polymer-forming cytoskeletal protein [Kiritimatiellia bacterium]